MMRDPSFRSGAAPGFTLVEMIVVVFLLVIAMLGILAVFDASARINKSEQDVADAQGAVRYGIYTMTRAIRMAGSGGLYVTQAVLNRPAASMPGITVLSANGYDNVTGASVTDLTGTAVPVRNGTDMIEIRGVIGSPLLGFDLQSGCANGNCTGSTAVVVKKVTFDPSIGQHVNDDAAKRPQFGTVDAYTPLASATLPMYVIVSGSDDLHGGCSVPYGPQHYPQATYNVGAITAATTLSGASPSFGTVNFDDAVAKRFNGEDPTVSLATNARSIGTALRHAGVLDDLIFFINNTDPLHPALSQGTRRGNAFDVVTLADDVEDMQIAYGVDTDGNNAINRLTAVAAITATDPDLNVSNQPGGDEWRPNVPTETPYTVCQFQSDAPGCAAGFAHPGFPAAAHCPTLHGVMIALVAKSKDPDPTFKAPVALGYRAMNTPNLIAPPYPDTAQYPGQPRYRRRVQMLKINLRNYAYAGN